MTDAERFLADDPPFATPEEFAKVMKERDGKMRLIDADALAKEMENAKYVSNTSAYAKGCNDVINYYIRRLKELPTIDPVRRARYIEAKVGGMGIYPDGQVMCSECETIMPSTWRVYPPYCFGCGAKMDGAT